MTNNSNNDLNFSESLEAPPPEMNKLPINRTKEDTAFFFVQNEALLSKLSHKLKRHTERNANTSHINGNVYHLLCNPFTFVNAYTKISKNKGALTKGISEDDQIMEFFGVSNAIEIANKFKQRRYFWKPVRRVMIDKPGKKKKRTIDTPTQEDRIVQEAIRGILESIYEPVFSEFEQDNDFYATNYGFRPGKSTWHAVSNFKYKAQGATHVVEGDIVGAYNNVDHDILLKILSIRIKDKYFLKVIRDLLTSGIMFEHRRIHSLVGTPQGGIVSPLLFNIYIFELDKYIYKTFILPNSQIIAKPRVNPEYSRIRYLEEKSWKTYTLLRYKSFTTKSPADKTAMNAQLKNLKILRSERLTKPNRIPSTLPKKLFYARYADDWVLATTGPKAEAEEIRNQIAQFLQDHLKLQLDPDKTLVSRIDSGFDFLGFSLKQLNTRQNKIKSVLQELSNGAYRRIYRRTTSRMLTIYPSSERIYTNLRRNKFCRGSDLQSLSQAGWIILDEFEIVLKYRQIFMGMYNYYRFCDSLSAIRSVYYVLLYSCAKTLSYRQKSTVKKIFDKYGPQLTISRDVVKANGIILKRLVSIPPNRGLIIKQKPPTRHTQPEQPPDPFYLYTYRRTKFKMYNVCRICGKDEKIALHHINSLRSLKSKQKNIKTVKDRYSYFRSRLNRLQIPVCPSCHLDITNGIYSDRSPVEFYDQILASL